MDKINKNAKAVKALQAETDHRTEVENQAIQLISECRFREANDLLESLDDSIVRDEWNEIIHLIFREGGGEKRCLKQR